MIYLIPVKWCRVSTSTSVMIQHLVKHFIKHHMNDYIYQNIRILGTLSTLSVNFTLHTEPSVSPPEFSIICRTEGGPATHVYWFRPNRQLESDSDHETSQLIVDTSHNSVYENRLRVRGREGGDYTCDIKSTPFSDAISFVHGYINIKGL